MANSESLSNKFTLNLSQEDVFSMDKIQREFWERIQTYLKDQIWVKMPIELSPPFCAQYGWQCLNSSILECVTCNTKLSVGNVKIENISYKTCIKKIIEDLKACHKKHCPWPLTPTPETFIKMHLLPKEEAFKQFSRRVKQLLPFKSSLPLIENKVFDNLGLNEQHVTSLCQMIEINKEDISHFERAAIVLAATGWTFDLEKSKGEIKYITCCDCQRSSSLCLFKSYNTNGRLICLDDSDKKTEIKDSQDINQTSHFEPINGNNSNIFSKQRQENTSELINYDDNFDEPEPKRKKFSLVCFDPLYEHRPWCLWLLTDEMCLETEIKSQEKNESKTLLNGPGWKIFIKCLLQNIVPDSNTETPSKGDLKSAREMLETWVTSE